MRHSLSDSHKDHLRRVGIESPPENLEISEPEYQKHFAEWKKTGPYAPDSMIHEKVLAHVAWIRQCAKRRAEESFAASFPKQAPVTERRVEFHVEKESKFWKIIAIILFALLLVLLFTAKGHAQFSHVNYVNFQSSGTNITGAFFTSPFNINCVTNLTCTVSGNTLAISAAGGAGSGCIPPGSTANALLFDAGGGLCNDVTKWTSNGTTTITGAATGILDISAIATFKIPTSAGCVPTVSALLCYDSTNNKFTFGQNGSTVSFGVVGTCTNQAITAIFATGPPTCATITSAFVNNTIALTGTDINTSNQVTATHIAGGMNTDLAIFNATGNVVNYGGVTCTNQVLASLTAAGAGGCHTVVSTDTSGTFPATAHNLLSATHGDTTASAAVRGGGIFALGASPTWTQVAHSSATGGYFKWNGTDIVASTGAAGGTGACSANQFETTDNADAAPTCAQPAYSGISGTPTLEYQTVQDSGGTPVTQAATIKFTGTAVTSTATAAGVTTVTLTAGAGGGGCTSPGSTNQLLIDNGSGGCSDLGSLGTTTTVLHGNAAGASTYGAVVSADLNITGTTCTNQVVTVISSAAAGTCTTITSAYTSGTFSATAHNLLSATHGDTTASSAVRGGGIFAIGASPTWTQLAHSSATGGYFKWNGTDIVASTLAASGTGACSASNWVNTNNADAAPTCSQPNFTDLAGSIALAQTPLTTRGDLLTVGAGTTLSRLAIGSNTNCLTSNGTDPVWAACGAGTVNAATQFSSAYYSAAGSSTTLSGLAPPTSQSIPFILTSTPSAGVATAPAWVLPGVPIDARTTTTETITNTDREELITLSNSGATAVTLPQAGSGNFVNNFSHAECNINTGLVTITPTTSTINGNATQIVPNHWCSYIYSDNTNYRASTTPDIAAFPNCTDTAGNHLNFTSATGALSCGTTASLATQYTKLRCEPGLGDGLNAITSGSYLQSTCYNDSGVTWTITGIKCFTDNSGSSTLAATNGAGTALLSPATVTCTTAFAAGTQSGTTTIANGDFIKFTFAADGTSKQTTWVVSMTQ